MSRRMIAAMLALVAAAVAVVLVVAYSAGADKRAVAELAPTSVLVVTQAVPAGTPSEALADLVAVREIPASAVVPGGVASLGDVAEQVTVAPLVPGEQLLMARFALPETLETPEVEVPEGLHLVTIALEPRRVLGGHLAAGDTVGFFVSVGDGAEKQTHIVLHKVLVTRVTGGVPQTPPPEAAPAPAVADSIQVTLAVTAADAEKVIFASEYHPIWLSLEPEEAPEDGTRIVTAGNLYS